MRPTSILFAACLALAAAARAEFRPEATAPVNTVPSGMNYQGRLEKDGFPVTATKTMAFRLYNVATGGAALWSSGNLSVVVAQGLFSTVLDIPFSALMGNTQKYLEIEVEGVTLSPRDPVRSVPYAKVAQTVEGTIDISTSGLTFQTGVGDSLAISSVSGRVGIGTSSPLARLHVSSGTGETGNIVVVSTGASTLVSIDGNGQLTANTFVGDGTGLRNLVRRSGDSMSGPLTLNGSTLTVLGNAFSVNTSDLWVGGSKVGVLTASPNTALEVNGASQFGQNATKSTFSATGALSLDRNASLTAGTTFYVGNGRVGVNTLSPGTTLQILGDVYIGEPVVHDLTAASDLLVEGNFIVDGTFIQHAGGASQFSRLGISGGLQGTQTFAVGYTSFVVTTGGNAGVNTLTPLAKLTVNGDSSFANPSTFQSSVTVKDAVLIGNAGQSAFSATGALTLGTALAVGDGGTGATSAGNARTNLGLVIGTDVQAFDADLTDLSDGGISGAKVDLSTVTTAIGNLSTVYQPLDADLTDLADGGIAGTKVDLSTVTTAINNLSTVYQPLDADLTDLADGGIAGSKVDLSTVTSAIATHAGLTGTSAHGGATANTSNSLVVRDAAGNIAASTAAVGAVSLSGKVISAGTAPTVTACGTGSTMAANSTDTAGRITIGATPPVASCVITFSIAFANAPTCVVSVSNNRSNTTATATTTLTVNSAAFATADTVDYICFGH